MRIIASLRIGSRLIHLPQPLEYKQLTQNIDFPASPTVGGDNLGDKSPFHSLQMDQQNSDIGRRDAADSARLSQRNRPYFCQFFPGFRAKLPEARIIEALWNALLVQPPHALD